MSNIKLSKVLTLSETLFENKHINEHTCTSLTLSTEQGLSVAHLMAAKGYLFTSLKMLTLKTVSGITVKDLYLLNRRNHDLSKENIFFSHDKT